MTINHLPTMRSFALLALAGLGLFAAAAAQTPAAAPATAASTGTPGLLPGDPERGLKKAATCIGCHAIPGYKADFPSVYHVPMIGGQNAAYLESALHAYKKGERRFPSMIATAKSLSDQDIADVAAYFAAQK